MVVGKAIQLLREEIEMTQKDLAEKINISYSVMNRIELGDRPIRDVELKRIATVLNVSTDYLLGLTNIRTPHNVTTIAAHHDGEDWTEEELEDIENFKEYVRTKRESN